MSEFPYQKERVKSRHVLLGAVAFGIAALFVYLGFSSRTSTWPETNCNVMGKRVVRADAPIGPYRSIVVLYRGEYHLRYTVDSRDYFLWVSSGWVDKDPQFVQDKMSSDEQAGCRYQIRYNPSNPAEAVASR